VSECAKGKGIGRRTIVAALVRPRPGRAFWFRMAAAACWHGRDEENTRWGVLRASRGQIGDVVLPYLARRHDCPLLPVLDSGASTR